MYLAIRDLKAAVAARTDHRTGRAAVVVARKGGAL